MPQRPEQVMEPRTFTCDAGSLPYRWFAPERDDGVRLPLVIFLHGAGERGADNRRQLVHGVAHFVGERDQERRPCFVAAPQCPHGRYWDPVLLEQFAAAMVQEPGVDPDRVYLTGLSMGGFATFHVAAARPDLFAAALPICGGGEESMALALSTLPLRVFHGDRDRTVPVERSRRMVAAVRRCGGDVAYTEYEGVAHDSWTRTYADEEVHEWLFAQRRPPRVPQLTAGERVVFLGGAAVAAGGASGGFVERFERELRARRPRLAVEVVAAGFAGAPLAELLPRFAADSASDEPTTFVVVLGAEHVREPEGAGAVAHEAFEAGVRNLLQRIAASGARAVVCTPPSAEPPRDTASPAAALDEHAASVRRIAADANVPLIDLRRRCAIALAARAEPSTASADQQLLAETMLAAFGVFPAPNRPGGR